jgi:hypothetical protein
MTAPITLSPLDPATLAELSLRVLRPAYRDTAHRGDGARILAYQWLRLQAANLDPTTQSRRESGLCGKRLRVEVVLAGATAPEPLPVEPLVEADLWNQLPADLSTSA